MIESPQINYHEVEEFHRRIRAAVERDLFALEARHADAIRVAADCEKSVLHARSKLEALDRADLIYRSVFIDADYTPTDAAVTDAPPATAVIKAPNDSDEAKAHPQIRARIGDKRYRMLKHLESLDKIGASLRCNLYNLASATFLDPRRVRDQMASDVAAGFVHEDVWGFELTDAGKDLIVRFEESRTSRGIPLPSLEGSPSDADQAEQEDGFDSSTTSTEAAVEASSTEEDLEKLW